MDFIGVRNGLVLGSEFSVLDSCLVPRPHVLRSSLKRNSNIEPGRNENVDDHEDGEPRTDSRSISFSLVAARCPLTTALSIVPGSPVSIQSPARKRPPTGVRCRAAAAGRAPARRSPASRGRRCALSERGAARAGQRVGDLARRERDQLRRGPSAASASAPLDDERQVRRALAERAPLVEDPLHRRARAARRTARPSRGGRTRG